MHPMHPVQILRRTGKRVALVGGAVRDMLLNRHIDDWDYVAEGFTVEEVQDFLPAAKMEGKDFPVFYIPDNLSAPIQIALCRKEKKIGEGHKGFECMFDPSVTIEEDLSRRDLTINAIARLDEHTFIDPFGGQKDLHDKVLRHVSPAFKEDPLRVFRLARFTAQLTGFSVAPETIMIAKEIQGTLKELPTDRVFKELAKALKSYEPQKFFETLFNCEALDVFFDNSMRFPTRYIRGGSAQEVQNYGLACQFLDNEQIYNLCQKLNPPLVHHKAALGLYYLRQGILDGAIGLLDAITRINRNSIEFRHVVEMLGQHLLELEEMALSVKAAAFSHIPSGKELGDVIKAGRIAVLKEFW